MEQKNNVEQLLTRVEKMGFSPEVQAQVRTNLEKGLTEFPAYDTVLFGEDRIDRMDYQLNFGLSKKKDSLDVYLNSVDTMLQKEVAVPHMIIGDIDTLNIERLLMNKPQPDIVHPGNMQDFELAKHEHHQLVQGNMQWLMEKSPDTFNALVVKHNPVIDFDIPKELRGQQQELQSGLVKANTFSTYYNLTVLEMYSAMNERPVLKTLFKTKQDKEQTPAEGAQQENQQQNNRTFKTWLKPNFESRSSDGAAEIKFYPPFNMREKLREYNFEELKSMYSRNDVIYYLEKGSQVELTNLNKTGDPKILMEVDAEFKNFIFRKLTGEIITNHKPFLKEQLKVEVGTHVKLSKTDDPTARNVKKTVDETQQQRADRFAQLKEKTAATATGKTNDQHHLPVAQVQTVVKPEPATVKDNAQGNTVKPDGESSKKNNNNKPGGQQPLKPKGNKKNPVIQEDGANQGLRR